MVYYRLLSGTCLMDSEVWRQFHGKRGTSPFAREGGQGRSFLGPGIKLPAFRPALIENATSAPAHLLDLSAHLPLSSPGACVRIEYREERAPTKSVRLFRTAESEAAGAFRQFEHANLFAFTIVDVNLAARDVDI